MLDECQLKLLPTRSTVWAKRGVYPTLPLLDRHGKVAVFGAANLHTGAMCHHLAGSLAGAEQIHLLEQLNQAHPTEQVVLILDNGPTHRNQRVTAWLAAHPHFVCFWLPPYCGAEANPIEHCWKWLREHVTHNHPFTELKELAAATRQFFAEVASDPQAVLSRLGRM